MSSSANHCLSLSTPRNIGDSDIVSIGQTYTGPAHNEFVAKKKNQAAAPGTFWTRLREALREKTGKRFTQKEAAIRYQVKQGTISGEWNRGKGPKIERGIEIARDLGVTLDWLYMGREPKRAAVAASDVYASTLAGLWPQLSDEDKRDIVGAVRLKAAQRHSTDAPPFARESSRHGTS